MRINYFKNQTLRPYPILYITTLGYLIYLLRFYIREYEVPDYFLYEHFAKQKLPAKDGFSSLFIFLSQKLTEWYDLIHILLALSLPLSFLIINLAFFKNVESSIKRVMFLLLTISMGCWHYFYGKIYYEFPFIALNFALILLISGKKLFYENDSESYTTNYKDILLYLLIGFCFSWKAHSIFLIIGILYLLYVNKYLVITFKNCAIVTIFFLLGYLVGNYQLISNFSETIAGLKGYKAESKVKSFLFEQNTVWDHVNVTSFNEANINIFTLIIIFIILPLFTRSKSLSLLNLIILVLFIIVTSYFLAGSTWQGFSISLLAILICLYCLANIDFKAKSPLILIIISLIAQIICIFIMYIPKQINWFRNTENAIQVLEKNSNLIFKQVNEIISVNGEKYSIYVSLRRNNRYDHNPLEAKNQSWNNLFQNQCKFECKTEYEIIIQPEALKNVASYVQISSRNIYYTNQEYTILLNKKISK